MTRDLIHAMRQIAKRPGFTALASLTLALGIGANTAVFSMVNAALFKQVPAADPGRLVRLALRTEPGGGYRELSYPEYLDYRDGSGVFSQLVAYYREAIDLSSGGEPVRLRCLLVSDNYFAALGQRPALGRVFAPDEDSGRGAVPVAVLAHDLWRGRFGADTALIGQTITLNGSPVVVIGVAQPGFAGTELDAPVDLWLPMSAQPIAAPARADDLNQRGFMWLSVAGRLAPGVSRERADAAVKAVSARLAIAYPGLLDQTSAEIVPFRLLDPEARAESAPVFALLMMVPALVLLIACANLANLLLARGLARRREIGVRVALGASRWRLVRQLTAETVVLAAIAATLAVVLSFWVADLLPWLAGSPLRLPDAFDPDLRVVVFTVVVALVAGCVFGVIPALATTKADPARTLRDEGPGPGGGRGRGRLMSVFVVGQLAVSLVLLVTAGLFLRALAKASSIELGFERRQIAMLSFDLPRHGYDLQQRLDFYREITERAGALPGVRASAVADQVPLSGRIVASRVVPEGWEPGEESPPSVYVGAVAPGYFATLRTPLLEGRDFTPRDDAGSPRVAIVNETLARRYWPDSDPLGQRLGYGGPDYFEVVGVVRDSRYDEPTEDTHAFMYLPLAQEGELVSDVTLLVRTEGDPSPGTLESLRALLTEMDPTLPAFRVRTMSQQVERRLDKQAGASTLLGAFGFLALLLATLGLYGVMSYGVAQRTREIGVRRALGARRAEVLRLFVARGGRLAAVGVLIGLALAAVVARLIRRYLFGVTPIDLLAFAGAATLLTGVVLFASYLAARRAARVDPVDALRYE